MAMRFFYVSIPDTTGIPVVSGVAKCIGIGEIIPAMNSINRLVYGLLSSLLLAAGFVRAADRLDPMNNILTASNKNNTMGIAAPCIAPCDIASQTT
jgi:hypothetical protein